jgi:YidC/Oxa1 family membrane protein insertase
VKDQRNLILAVALTGLLLLGWDYGMRYFYPQPATPVATSGAAPGAPAAASAAKPTREGGLTDPAAIALEKKDLAQELAAPGRVRIDAPAVKGSIKLTGAQLDDLTLNRHTETIEKNSGPVRLFSPAGTPAQHFATFGWAPQQGMATPNAATVWQADGAVLTPRTPVTLRWTNPTGQTFAIRFEIDDNYLIKATQSVANAGAGPVIVQPIAQVSRTKTTASIDTWNVHSGPIAQFDGSVTFDNDYDTIAEAKARTVAPGGAPGWIGFTDIYWMSALVPQAEEGTRADFRSPSDDLYLANVFYPQGVIQPGQSLSRTTRLFAGAKENKVLEAYEASGITNFSLSIDWGWFRWFEKPILWLLDALFRAIGNFGLAIIGLTFIVRGIMFPIAQRQFASMAAMRAIQPKMKALQERYKDDREAQQREIMALYKKEGVNPLAGCLPIFLQIPVFFALYKVLILVVEMRHQPFALWIKDLSAPDPLHFLNLFGLLPFTPPSFLGIGVLALLLGITMYYQFKLNPAQMDPIQQQMFALMPWIMMFVMAPFAAGLLIYWITSNILTIAQQWYLYSKHPALAAQVDKDQADSARAKGR